MRVLHLVASPVFSGPTESVALIASAQRSLGHEVAVAIDRKRATVTSEEPARPRLEALGLLDERGLELSTKSSPWAALRDVRRLRTLELDVLHCHSSHDHTLARLARSSRVCLIRSIHAARSLRWSTPAADGWTVPVDDWARRLLGAPVMILPSLVDAAYVPPVDREARKRELGLGAGPVVGMISTFQASRRHDVALAAFALVHARRPDARLLLVGDGVREAEIRADVDRRGLAPHVLLAGYQSGQRFVEHLQAMDEVWILGLGNDFGARAAAQARSCGARVVAVDHGALPRLADTVVPCEPDALAAVALTGERRAATLEAPLAVAGRLVELYRRAAAVGGR